MSHNTFGHLFRVTTWGESHGPALGCVVDGCPPGIPLTEADIQPWMDARKPGTSKFVTQRRESDTVKILSGTFADERMAGPVTTGTPISLLIENEDQRSKDYAEIRDAYRPGLGTAYGEAMSSPAHEVDFVRQSPNYPTVVLGLRYNDREGLMAMGVRVDGYPQPWDDAGLRRTAEPFPNDRRYAPPPPGWNGY